MTDTLKSVLFVDYDSLHLALRARDPVLGRRFAARPAALLEAIEAGTLIGGSGPLGRQRRRILMRRCYADPRLIGKARDSFVTQGFQIIDCPTLPGHERNSAEVQITLDTIDALGHPTAFDEFILLGAESDFTPLIYRLRAHNRAASIFASGATAGSYRAIADGIVEEGALVDLLAGLADVHLDEEEQEDDAPRPAAGRDDLAGLARRIHNATNVPLFAPKVYAELFRALAEEIAERGYDFQQTAENVAGRLIAGGRKASRRQVAFVVKGLALKGHILSETDTPQRLAEVFREQVLYLARHAGIEIDPRVERQVQGWIAGGSVASEPTDPMADAHPAGAEPGATTAAPSADPVQSTLAIEAEAMAGPLEEAGPLEGAGPPEASGALDTDEPATAPSGDVDFPALDDDATSAPDELPALPPEIEAEPVAPDVQSPVLVVEDLAALADSPEAGDEDQAEDEVAAPPVAIEPPAVRAAPTVRPPVPRGAPQRGGVRPAEVPLDPFESSLLAAIAEAVQAVEPGKSGTAPPVAPADADARIEPSLDLPQVELEPKARTDGKSAAEIEAEADIGDEIQRILAAYNQSRKPAGG